jgi:hypothetical protein
MRRGESPRERLKELEQFLCQSLRVCIGEFLPKLLLVERLKILDSIGAESHYCSSYVIVERKKGE